MVEQISFRTIKIGVGTTVMGFCSGGQKLGSTPNEYSVSKWELIAEEQGRGQWMENYLEETSGVRGIWLNSPNQNLVGYRPHLGVMEDNI